MPKRLNTRSFPSDEVQGEDSFIVVSRLTVGEAREADRKKDSDDSEDQFGTIGDLFKKHVRSWNWVDDDGEPMPLPRDDPSVVDQLTDQEFSFVAECIGYTEPEEESKNS